MLEVALSVTTSKQASSDLLSVPCLLQCSRGQLGGCFQAPLCLRGPHSPPSPQRWHSGSRGGL